MAITYTAEDSAQKPIAMAAIRSQLSTVNPMIKTRDGMGGSLCFPTSPV